MWDDNLNILGSIPTNVPLNMVGLEFEAVSNTLYVAGNYNSLYRLDPTTGNHTVIGVFGVFVNDLVWVPPCP